MTTPTRENEMEDKELLELAAKAHGFYDDATDSGSLHGLRRTQDGDFYWVDENGWHPWWPQNDDGQALRLAVKLGMTIEQFDDDGGVVVTHGVSVRASEDYADDRYAASRDPYAATRRAIVRAAAEIGKSLPTPTIRSPEALSNSTDGGNGNG